MYELAFFYFFKLCSERAGKPVKWHHLHSEGWYSTTLDMCSKQIGGFGSYLSSINPQHRDWRWQLRSCTRFYKVHFIRSINNAVSNSKYTKDSPRGRIRALLNAKTPEEYHHLCELLMVKEEDLRIRA
ncbi:hypothetical protein K469DRAFT_281494 [Zopfia rhizophila CBS 207.26]|uniref:Uncharacterized protein n=1 Tax=Zopfia rhizophila CBS 207.26 TaxID=1314779 RepID=A0A6A6ESW7_9PEZI|nr:hypothetical protein K469DRAFT_281494 [Zopfia rhizophila CBS 207.26]